MISSLGATAQASICGAISSWSTYRLHPFARHLLWPFRMPLDQCYNFAPSTKCHPKSSQKSSMPCLPGFLSRFETTKPMKNFPSCWTTRDGPFSPPSVVLSMQAWGWEVGASTHRIQGKGGWFRPRPQGWKAPSFMRPLIRGLWPHGVLTFISHSLPETNSEKTPLKIGGTGRRSFPFGANGPFSLAKFWGGQWYLYTVKGIYIYIYIYIHIAGQRYGGSDLKMESFESGQIWIPILICFILPPALAPQKSSVCFAWMFRHQTKNITIFRIFFSSRKPPFLQHLKNAVRF